MDVVETVVRYVFLGAAACFVLGLHLMNTPGTARRGNLLSGGAMAVAVAAALVLIVSRGGVTATAWIVMILGVVVGSVAGAHAARAVKMTAMPQLVGVFNGFGGGASALVASAELLGTNAMDPVPVAVGIAAAAGILVGTVTFSGSFVAFGKLQGFVPGRPLTYPLQKTANLLLFLGVLGAAVWLAGFSQAPDVIALLAVVAFVLGILLVIPIGGADMPVVISLLNSYSGLAASAAGFVLNNQLLVLAGALVGAAGLILTQHMCRAMNRSLANVAFGAFGGGEGIATEEDGDKTVRRTTPDEAALLLAYASSVVIVPGYGLAVAQAQHDVKKLTDLLKERGVRVRFAIHPVAGRMPGHMNVLLAEADVPYDLLLDLDDVNPEFEQTDVVVVVGANDVVNPVAREPGSAIAGMPILDVDRARNVIVVKRSLSPGFAGIDNPLFYMDRTLMLFSDAQEAMAALAREVKEVG